MLPGFSTTAGSADVVEGDGAATEEDQGECKCGQRQREFISSVANQPVMQVDFEDGDGEIDADGKSSHPSEQAQQDEQAAKEFREGGEVGGPSREPEAGDKLSMVVKSAENLVVAVVEHDGAQGEAHDKECEGLQAVEVAQVVPPAEGKHRLQQRGGGRKGRGRVGAGYRN